MGVPRPKYHTGSDSRDCLLSWGEVRLCWHWIHWDLLHHQFGAFPFVLSFMFLLMCCPGRYQWLRFKPLRGQWCLCRRPRLLYLLLQSRIYWSCLRDKHDHHLLQWRVAVDRLYGVFRPHGELCQSSLVSRGPKSHSTGRHAFEEHRECELFVLWLGHHLRNRPNEVFTCFDLFFNCFVVLSPLLVPVLLIGFLFLGKVRWHPRKVGCTVS